MAACILVGVCIAGKDEWAKIGKGFSKRPPLGKTEGKRFGLSFEPVWGKNENFHRVLRTQVGD